MTEKNGKNKFYRSEKAIKYWLVQGERFSNLVGVQGL